MQSTSRRKHSKAEIAAKIAQADDLAAQGMLQREIAPMLGVTAMTLHRWRKARPEPAGPAEIARFEHELAPHKSATELELENSRLRRLVVDLLLEKAELEERARGSRSRPLQSSPAHRQGISGRASLSRRRCGSHQ
jgi:putative transposase